MEVTPVQAASLIGKSERTIQRWIQLKKLPARIAGDGSYRVNVADLEQFQQDDETLLARVEALEREVAELKRQINALVLPKPIYHPPAAEPLTFHLTPGTIISARSFGERHGISRDRMAGWIKRGEIQTTPEPHGGVIQHNLTQEQQAQVIIFWESLHILYTRCPDCPHKA